MVTLLKREHDNRHRGDVMPFWRQVYITTTSRQSHSNLHDEYWFSTVGRTDKAGIITLTQPGESKSPFPTDMNSTVFHSFMVAFRYTIQMEIDKGLIGFCHIPLLAKFGTFYQYFNISIFLSFNLFHMMFMNLFIFLHTMIVVPIPLPDLTFRSTFIFPQFVRRRIILLLSLSVRFDGRKNIINRTSNKQCITCPYEGIFSCLFSTQLCNGLNNSIWIWY